jgi:hypothetical protein
MECLTPRAFKKHFETHLSIGVLIFLTVSYICKNVIFLNLQMQSSFEHFLQLNNFTAIYSKAVWSNLKNGLNQSRCLL